MSREEHDRRVTGTRDEWLGLSCSQAGLTLHFLKLNICIVFILLLSFITEIYFVSSTVETKRFGIKNFFVVI